MKKILVVLWVLIGFGLMVLITNLMVCKPAFASVNINKIVRQYIEKMAKSNLSESELEKNAKDFLPKLEEEVKTLASEKKITLLMSEAVIAGATDYTEELEKRLNKKFGSPK